jgi:methylated-DNA-[protein]-cysteine S-methyltransferase
MTNDRDPASPPQSGHCTASVATDLALLLAWTTSGISRVTFINITDIPQQQKAPPPPFVQDALRLLRAYFRRKRVSFSDIPLDLGSPTPFQLAVWHASSRIPQGQTRTYKWIAHEIRNPAAVRAVGNALGKNPLPILIPCHRVIRTDASLGGFTAGLELKRRLLALEQLN